MKIGIIYATNREEATVQIVKWMTDALQQEGYTVTAGKTENFDDFNCDAYLIGGAVYAFSVKRTKINTWLRNNSRNIQNKPLGAFVIASSDPLPPKDKMKGNFFTKFLKQTFVNPDRYINTLIGLLPSAPKTTALFKGYMDQEDKDKTNFISQESKVRNWAIEACKSFEN